MALTASVGIAVFAHDEDIGRKVVVTSGGDCMCLARSLQFRESRNWAGSLEMRFGPLVCSLHSPAHFQIMEDANLRRCSHGFVEASPGHARI